MKKYRTHIELFAGCGGMAVGMENAGFDLVFANEVSPMASNTFAHNLLGVDIAKPNDRIRWIHSRYSRNEYEKRLRENLLSHDLDENCELDFDRNLGDLNNCLVVGDVRHLRAKLIQKGIKDPYKGELDLVSGGPPCQSFSLAGKRELNNYKNRLPLDFAEICEVIQPKVVMLENVKGILSAFDDNGEKHYAWFEVAKAFALKGFAPVCMLINSKYFGVAQNRPRYIMLAFRRDIFKKLNKFYPGNEILANVSNFMTKVKRDFKKLSTSDLDYYEIEKSSGLFDGKILPKPTTLESNKWHSVKDAINDLIEIGKHNQSAYVEFINKRFKPLDNYEYQVFNHHHRSHTKKTKDRFLFYQLLNHANGLKEEFIKNKRKGDQLPTKTIRSLFEQLSLGVKEFERIFSSFRQFKLFIDSVSLTKKHSQRALIEHLPSPAQLTIPDDTCHYSPFETRVLTVREIARIQSFPDWFLFKSKETTGGNNRSFEVPQYTQVGNAVPPKLAFYLGKHLNSLLNKIESNGL